MRILFVIVILLLCTTCLLSQSTDEALFTGEAPLADTIAMASPDDSSTAADDNIEEFMLDREQYCLGCINTIDLYGKVLKEQLLNMYKRKMKEGELIAGREYIETLCEHKSIGSKTTHDYVRYTCYKVIHQYRRALLDSFQGQTSANTIDAKIFTAKHHVCQNVTQACPKAYFTSSLITSNKERRNKCTACRIVANDMDNRLRVLKKDITAIDWEKEIGHKICSKLMHNHSPYAWLEGVCEHITDEDNSKKFKKILVDRYHFLSSLDESSWVPPLEETLCKEFYKCEVPQFRDIYSEPLQVPEEPSLSTPEEIQGRMQQAEAPLPDMSEVPAGHSEEL